MSQTMMETTELEPRGEQKMDKPAPMPRNGVDVPKVFATLDAIKAQPEIAQFQFRASNRWISGTHSRSVIAGYYGAMQEMTHQAEFSYAADHPPVVCGEDHGPTPVEFLLHALATCLTAGLVNVASVRGIDLEEVESTVEGDIDLQGILGLSDEVRNGFESVRVRFNIEADAPTEKVAEIVDQAVARSAVYDIVTNGIPVSVSVDD